MPYHQILVGLCALQVLCALAILYCNLRVSRGMKELERIAKRRAELAAERRIKL